MLLPCARDVRLSLNERTDWQKCLHDAARFAKHTLWPSRFSNVRKKGMAHVTDYARDNCNSRYVFRRFFKILQQQCGTSDPNGQLPCLKAQRLAPDKLQVAKEEFKII